MATDVSPMMTLEALRSVPLFASLDDAATRELRSLLHVEQVGSETELFHHGDAGDAMYLIETGRIRIHVEDTVGHDVTLAELAGGDFFGEMALFEGKPRAADATVIEEARLAVLSREDFLTFVHRYPDVALKMLSAVTERLRRTDELLRQRVSRNVNEEAEAMMTPADRMTNTFANFAGSWKFFIASLVLILIWVLLNAWLLRSRIFDVYPFNLLDLVFGIIAGLQAPIILMAQNRQSNQDRLRADIEFQINLKNELNLAEVLRRLDVLESERLPRLFEEQNAQLKDGKRKN
ncbi:MAG TPA: DUF1003 domain-containing protein [Pyrinomonadaceae bacterium]